MEKPVIEDMLKPNAARLYDYYLGGAQHFEADRAKAQELIAQWPNVRPVARHNRAFLRRAVLAALDEGITQFLDLGSGIPTAGNVHEVVLEREPAGRVVYCDNEHVAYARSAMLLDEQDLWDRVTVIQQDLRTPRAVLADPEARRLLDFNQPICLLMIAVLHFVAEADDPAGLVARYREALPAGSWFAATHIACDRAPAEQQRQVEQFAQNYANTSNPLVVRDHAEFTAWFDGFDLVEPGITWLPDWRAEGPVDDSDQARALAWCGAGRVPSR